MDGNLINILTMIIVGVVCGSLAGFIMRGTNSGFIVNAILGIAGAVVGGYIFDKLGMTPGEGIVRIIDETFSVKLPQNLVGMIISGTLGAMLILFVARTLNGRRGRR